MKAAASEKPNLAGSVANSLARSASIACSNFVILALATSNSLSLFVTMVVVFRVNVEGSDVSYIK